jgi:Rieske Fe-S protein
MPLDEDKYPQESGRRRFVKGVVGSAALGTVGVGGAAAINTATSQSGGGGGPTNYIGVQNTGGPAPRGMPLIPVEVTSAGEIQGVFPETRTETVGGREVTVAEEEIGGTSYSSSWFQYCGVEQYEGVQPGADADNFFRGVSGAGYAWQTEAVDAGEKLTLDMFDDYETWGNGIGRAGLGKPASARWRSETEGAKTIPVQVLRTPELPKMINGEQGFRDYSKIPSSIRTFLDAATDQNVMAWLNKCTHFCCVPGIKKLEGSSDFGGANQVYCQCHQSIYDPFNPVNIRYIARPRPSE